MGERERATFGAGCFWCVEAVFRELQGVEKIASGYTGGTVPNPTYEQVCTGRTGHAEAIQITFDPAVISYEELLEVFWKTHDPTTLYHQDYYLNNPAQPYCRVVIAPKVEKFRQQFAPKLNKQPAGR